MQVNVIVHHCLRFFLFSVSSRTRFFAFRSKQVFSLTQKTQQADTLMDSREELDFKFDEELHGNQRKRTTSSTYDW